MFGENQQDLVAKNGSETSLPAHKLTPVNPMGMNAAFPSCCAPLPVLEVPHSSSRSFLLDHHASGVAQQVPSLGFGEIQIEKHLGNGRFGAMKRVHTVSEPHRPLILKAMQKAKLVSTALRSSGPETPYTTSSDHMLVVAQIDGKRKQSAMREKQALQLIDSNFILKLHGTLLDQDQVSIDSFSRRGCSGHMVQEGLSCRQAPPSHGLQVYLLLEHAGGGDVWGTLYEVWTEGIEKNEFGGVTIPLVREHDSLGRARGHPGIRSQAALFWPPGCAWHSRCSHRHDSHQHDVLGGNQIAQWAPMVIIALEHIHTRGVLYRDLRPENILIGADGTLKVLARHGGEACQPRSIRQRERHRA